MIMQNSLYQQTKIITCTMFLCGLVCLSACGGSSDDKNDAPQTVKADSSTLIQQESASLDWHHPGQWVVVNYWASWCGYCKHEVPELNELSALGVKVIGISAVPVKQAELDTWRTSVHANYPLLKSAPDSLTNVVGRVDRLPTTYIIDPNGKFIGPFVGSVTKAELQRYMQ